MRRVAVVVLAVCALAGCSDKKPDPAVAAVCRTRAQTQSAVDHEKTATFEQYPQVISGLEAAIRVAPADIKPDFVKVHDVLKPFVDALVKAGGDTQRAAQDPQYASAVQAIGTRAATDAGKRIRAYYAKHC